MTFPPVPVHPVGACPVCDARRPCPLCASRPGEEHASGCPSWKEKALMMEEHSSAGLLVPADTIEKALYDMDDCAIDAGLTASRKLGALRPDLGLAEHAAVFRAAALAAVRAPKEDEAVRECTCHWNDYGRGGHGGLLVIDQGCPSHGSSVSGEGTNG